MRQLPPIERATPGDLVMLAMDRSGGTPEQFGAVLVLAPGADVAGLERVVAERLRSVPRLRQRLVTVPPGCGRPVWADDPADDPARHVRRLRCAAPGDEQALLDLAARIVTDPLPRTRPLWAAAVATGLTGGRIAWSSCSTTWSPTASPGSRSSSTSQTVSRPGRGLRSPGPGPGGHRSRPTPSGPGCTA